MQRIGLMVGMLCGLTLSLVGCDASSVSSTPVSPTFGSSASVYVLSDRLQALNGTTGQVRWTYAAPFAATPSLGVSRQVVYLATDHLTALSAATGQVLWESAIPTMGARQVLVGPEQVYVAVGDQLIALATQDGHLAWTTTLQAQTTPVLSADGHLLYLLANARVVARDAGTGALRWVTAPLPEDETVSTLTLATSGTVLVETVDAMMLPHLYAYRLGALAWEVEGERGLLVTDRERVYLLTPDDQGQRLTALMLGDGHLAWSVAFGRGIPHVAVEQQLYLGLDTPSGGMLTALDPTTGQARWSLPSATGITQLLLHNDQVILAGHTQISAIASATHQLQWLTAPMQLILALTPDTLIAQDSLGLVALPLATGVPSWHLSVTTTAGLTVQVSE